MKCFRAKPVNSQRYYEEEQHEYRDPFARDSFNCEGGCSCLQYKLGLFTKNSNNILAEGLSKLLAAPYAEENREENILNEITDVVAAILINNDTLRLCMGRSK